MRARPAVLAPPSLLHPSRRPFAAVALRRLRSLRGRLRAESTKEAGACRTLLSQYGEVRAAADLELDGGATAEPAADAKADADADAGGRDGGFRLSLVVGSAASGYRDGERATAQLSEPSAAAVLPSGELVFAERGNSSVRQLASTRDAKLDTVVGHKGGGPLRDGSCQAARLSAPRGLCVCRDGALVVCDTGNDALRCIRPERMQAVSTLVAGLDAPTAVVQLAGDELLIADTGAHASCAKFTRCPTMFSEPPDTTDICAEQISNRLKFGRSKVNAGGVRQARLGGTGGAARSAGRAEHLC